MLCKKAAERGCNVGILTDFDISGIAMCLKIPWAIRIGIDLSTVYALNLSREELRQVEERYNPDKNQLKYVTTVLDAYGEKRKFDLDGEYNHHLIKNLLLQKRKQLDYLKTTRIELDQIIDVVGADRFCQYIMGTMENEFAHRDYNYAVDDPAVSEIRPNMATTFVTRMDKMFVQCSGLKPAFQQISENLRKVNGLQPIDKERERMLNHLVKVIEEDHKVNHFLVKLQKFINSVDLPL